ncbi:MAG: 50S ribosomal protein L9 [Clostridia bacterium]|nr:50S ribosomal protein L9 [Clostridia bacterium]
MKVILTQDVRGKGKKGELIEASDGYCRNFLLPRKLAVEANAENLNVMKTQQAARDHKNALEKAAAEADAKKLSAITVTLKAKAGSGGRLFGAVTAGDVAEAINRTAGTDIAKQKVVLSETIKVAGTYTVKVKLYPEIAADVKVQVIAE